MSTPSRNSRAIAGSRYQLVRGRGYLVEALAYIVRQFPSYAAEHVVKLFNAIGAADRAGHLLMGEHPGDRDLGRRFAQLHCTVVDCAYDLRSGQHVTIEAVAEARGPERAGRW